MRANKRKAAIAAVALAGAAVTPLAFAGSSSAASDSIKFRMVRSAGAVANDCLKGADAVVKVTQAGPVEVMDIKATGLPPRREFDLFVTQLPDAPFGMAWYQGDMDSNKYGEAHGRFVGRFSQETFIVAPGVGYAPTPHDDLDASTNPATAPVHTFHLGLWFGSPRAAAAAGCPTTVTPFNGEHNAGIQAMSTTQIADLNGPLGRLK
jgi:hypothetical protein